VEDIKRGERFERVNVVGALCAGEHLAVKCYHQMTNSAFFEQWFKECLLRELPEGYTVIMDGASFHRGKALKKLAGGKVRLLFLPPYSPDYNPIEKTWANMKRFLSNNLKDFHSVVSGIYNYFKVIGS
jgi:transposase